MIRFAHLKIADFVLVRCQLRVERVFTSFFNLLRANSSLDMVSNVSTSQERHVWVDFRSMRAYLRRSRHIPCMFVQKGWDANPRGRTALALQGYSLDRLT
ncbi:MAG: hypothetical protein AAF250_09560 [Pseudomonadota bacterium]